MQASFNYSDPIDSRLWCRYVLSHYNGGMPRQNITKTSEGGESPQRPAGTMRIIDSHCHLDFPAFDRDREAVLAACRQAGLEGIVVPGVMAASWDRLLDVTTAHADLLLPALGLHPMFLDKHEEGDLDRLRQYIVRHRPYAVGEIGLDYYLRDPDRSRQAFFFEAQLEIAGQSGLPVILHVRKAHDEVLGILRGCRVPGGIVHAFNGSLQQARQYMELGFKLGFGGAVTYPRAKRLRRLAQQLPLHAIVLETDAPDMAPAAHRGCRNSPAYLPEVLDTLTVLRRESRAVIAEQTRRNTHRVFGLAR